MCGERENDYLPMLVWAEILPVIVEATALLTQRMSELAGQPEKLLEFQACFMPVITELQQLGARCNQAGRVAVGLVPQANTANH